jgi:restriction endonuclease S subunit
MGWPSFKRHARVRAVERACGEMTRDFDVNDLDWKPVRFPDRLDEYKGGTSYIWNEKHKLLGVIPSGQGQVVTVLDKPDTDFELVDGKYQLEEEGSQGE